MPHNGAGRYHNDRPVQRTRSVGSPRGIACPRHIDRLAGPFASTLLADLGAEVLDRERLFKTGSGIPGYPDCGGAGLSGNRPVRRLGIVVAAATPKERIDRLGAAINKIVQSPDIVEKFGNLGAIPRSEGPKEFGAFLANEDARWSAVVKASGVRIE